MLIMFVTIPLLVEAYYADCYYILYPQVYLHILE